jgi:hypothetical protein
VTLLDPTTRTQPATASAVAGVERASGPATKTRKGSVERFALVATAATFVLQPLLHPTGPGNSSPVDALTLVSLLAAFIWARSAGIRVRAPYTIGVGLLVVGGCLAGAFGPLPGAALLAVVQDIVLIGWCTAVGIVAARRGGVQQLATVWAQAAILAETLLVTGSLLGINAITGVIPREGNRALFTFGDPNYAATFWVMSIFIVYTSGRPQRRWLRLAGYVLLVWALLLTESNGGVVQLLIGATVLILLRVHRRHGVAACVALFLVLGGGVVAFETAVPLQSIQVWARDSGQPLLVNSLGRSNESSSQRSQLINEAIHLYRSDGILGSGPSSTKPLLADRAYPYAKEAHDDYLAALVERGPLGVLGIIALLASAAWRVGRVLSLRPGGTEHQPLARPTGLVAASIAVAVAATYYEVLHFRFVWGMLALVAVMARAAGDRRLLASRPDGSRT